MAQQAQESRINGAVKLEDSNKVAIGKVELASLLNKKTHIVRLKRMLRQQI